MTNNLKSEINELRAKFSSACEEGDYWTSKGSAEALLAENASLAQIRYLSRGIKAHAGKFEHAKRIRLALLSSYSIEFLTDSLHVSFFCAGMFLDIYEPAFNQFRQEILVPSSALYTFKPDVVVLSIEGEHLCPPMYKYSSLDDVRLVEDTVAEFRQLITTFREASAAAVIFQNLSAPTYPGLGVGDANAPNGVRPLVWQINAQLSRLAAEHQGIYVLDYDALVAKYGGLDWRDERMNFYAQAPVSKHMFPVMAKEFAKIARILFGGAKKCLVVDLDNTLWGGVLGEDGPDNIRIGAEYPGNAYRAFQEALISIKNRGILLAIASKNNPSDVDEAFESNPHMALQLSDFSDKQIGWQEKSHSLLEISENLKIGLEHMVFIDDNPVECAQVQDALPMVEVITFPSQPEHYAACLFEDGFFDALQKSSEDANRASFYEQRARAEKLRADVSNVEDFYRMLQMELLFASVCDKNLARTAQLTQKTNQLNATTHRYSEAKLESMRRDREWILVTVSVKDKFGDNGIVGVSFAKKQGDTLVIDTLLLSCRVIGRTVENAMLAFLCEQARLHKLSFVEGIIKFTRKNMPVRDVYKNFGFEEIAADTEGSRWRLSIDCGKAKYPDWFLVTDQTDSSH